MNNSVVFAGLPRSGITLLASMLNKDKDIYVTTSSPFVELLWRNYSIWSEDTYAGELDTDNIRQAKIPFLRGLTELYYSQLTSKPVVIDKRRSWQNIIHALDIFQRPLTKFLQMKPLFHRTRISTE